VRANTSAEAVGDGEWQRAHWDRGVATGEDTGNRRLLRHRIGSIEAPGRVCLDRTTQVRGERACDLHACGAELIACYLDIEHERFDERLHTTIDVPESIADLPIPTLLVQPLVENAVKHGIARSRSGGHLSIRATLHSSGELHISVRNTGAPLRGRLPGPAGGMGLRNVEQRLASYYGDAARFSLTTADNGETAAEIWLPAARERTSGPSSPARRARA
jgi:hypothetical protein